MATYLIFLPVSQCYRLFNGDIANGVSSLSYMGDWKGVSSFATIQDFNKHVHADGYHAVKVSQGVHEVKVRDVTVADIEAMDARKAQ